MQDIASIESSVAELRNSLGLQSTFDYNEAIQLVSTINSMVDLLYYDIANRIGRSNQFSAPFRQDIVNRSNQLNQSAKSLHNNLIQQQDSKQMRTLSRQMAQQWDELQTLIAQIPVEQRVELTRTSQQVAPLMAKMQMIYGY